MIDWKRCPISLVFFYLIVVFVINEVTAVDYSHRQDEIPKNVTQSDARTTRQLLELAMKIKKIKKKYTLQEGTEHLLQFGALLRTQILDTFGYLVYDRYDDFSIAQMEALYRVYHETLERKYNIFDIVPSVLKNADIRPTKICQYINENVQTCLKESSQLCMNIRRHNKRRLINLNNTPQIYQQAKIQENFPDGFSLKIILRHLQNNSLKFTPFLLSGLLHNIQYDSFDDEVRTAERELIRFLTKISKTPKHSILMTNREIQKQRTVSELLKTYLKNASAEFKNPVNFHANILAEHVVREVEAISENIELLGIVYENNTINLKYLFDLILPSDVIDKDLNDAKMYLLRKTDELQVISKYLRIEKYQQAGPDQLLMEILGQMRDIHFAVDIVSALHTHARFWHKSRAIENVDELLELFSAYENLRKVEKYENIMKTIDQIKNRLSDSKNVTIEFSCSHPRACLLIGLQIVGECAHVDEDTRNLIKNFVDEVTSKGSPAQEECPLKQSPFMKPETEDTNFTRKSNLPDTGNESRRGFPTTTKDVSTEEEEKKQNSFLDNSEPSPETTALPPTTNAMETGSTEIPVETEVSTNLSIGKTTKKLPITDQVTVTTEELLTTTEKPLTTAEKVITTTEEVLEETVKTSAPTEVSTIKDTTKNPINIESSTTECSNSEECSSDCSGENCSREDCSTGDCKVEKSCKGDDCNIKDCSGQNCTTTDCEGSECISNKCNGTDCSVSKTNTTCNGENCSEEKEGKTGCEGLGCLKEVELDCKGSDCPKSKETKDCEGSSCQDDKDAPCTGQNCPKSDCEGKNCPENPNVEVPKNKTTALCSNKDPHRQRKKDRLKKMHQFDVYSATSKYADMDTEDSPNESTKADEQSEKILINPKKKHSERYAVMEKAKEDLDKLKEKRKVSKNSKKERRIQDSKNSKKRVKDQDAIITDSKLDKNVRASEKNKNNLHSNNDRKRKMNSRKKNKLLKFKPNEDLLKGKDELIAGESSEVENIFKDNDLSENLDENSLKNLKGNNQHKNSYRKSNYPIDSEDMRFLYQTPKSIMNTKRRSNFDDLMDENDDNPPANRMFEKFNERESSDEIERKRKILDPLEQDANYEEDVPDNEEDYYDGEYDLPKSGKKLSLWYS